ncbi:MAG TPA: Yip1 family protein [Myxococcaceae bacterium]|jgi:hypothetical protein
MQASCPHCKNVFSTERTGIQFCPNCGQQINVPDPSGAAAPPPPPPGGAPGVPPSLGAGQRGPVPWEERGQRGLFGAFFETCKMLVMQPEMFWSRLRPDGSLGDGLFFGWICFAIYGVLNIPLQLVSSSLNRGSVDQILAASKDMPPEVRRMFATLLGGGSVGIIVGEIIIYPVFMIIGAAITHLFCMIFGVSKNGFNATVRVLGYAQAPYLIGWIPCCGQLVAAIYSIVLVIWGLARVQESTTARSVMAVLALPVLLCCCIFGAAMIAGMAGAGAANMR